jgi:hypothetical protein
MDKTILLQIAAALDPPPHPRTILTVQNLLTALETLAGAALEGCSRQRRVGQRFGWETKTLYHLADQLHQLVRTVKAQITP